MGIVTNRKVAANIQLLPGDTRSNGQDTTTQSLSNGDNVRDDFIVLKRKHATGFPQTGWYFIHDQQGAEFVAGRTYGLPESGRRNVGHRSHWLGYYSGDITLATQYILDHLRAGQLTHIWPAVPVRAAIAGKWRDVFGTRQQRPCDV